MKVMILGAGVVGVVTAWYLAKQGVEVVVIDRQSGPALETSFANAGQVSPGYASPWAAPGVPLKAMKWLLQARSPLAIRPDGSLWQWQWIIQLLANCRSDRYVINKSRMLRLASYSRACLQVLRNELGLQYEQRCGGTLQLFRTQAQLDTAERDINILQALGINFALLEPRDLATVEPALSDVVHKLTGGLRLPQDETGDCFLFTSQLARAATKLGVSFRFGQQIERLLQKNGRIEAVQIGDEILKADHFVVALGSYSRQFVAALPINLPVYPVKGYSLTIPMLNAAASPVSTILDETYKVAVTRFDERIRVGGMAELAGFDLALNPKRRHTLEWVVNDLFPRAGNLPASTFWTGLRPMTPDGTPIIGATTHPNLWLNTGHGTLGWTMSCGSGKLLSDLILGLPPEIESADLSMSRYV